VMADGWWLTPKFLWFLWILWFTIWLYYVSAPLVLSVILQLQLKRDSGALGAGAIAVRQWDNELRWAPCTFLALKF
jgi:hypothetical protein